MRLHIVQQHPTFEIADIMKITQPLTTTGANIKTESKNVQINVWDHFTKTKNGLASCDVCKVVLSIRGGQMNLMKHLRIQHSVYLNRIKECVGRVAIEQDEENDRAYKPRILRPSANSTKVSKPKLIQATSPVKVETEYIDFIEFPDYSNIDEDLDTEVNNDSASGDAFDDENEKRTNSVYNESDGGSSDFEPDEAEQNSDSSAVEAEKDDDDYEVSDYLRKSSTRGKFTFPTPDVAKCKGCNTLLSFRFKGTGNLIKHLKSELHIRRSNGDDIPVKSKRNRTKILQKSSDIWKYLSKLQDNNVKCNLCNVKLKSTGRSNLTNHLRACHQLLLLDDQVREADSKTEGSMQEQEQLEYEINSLVEFNDNDNIPLSKISNVADADETLAFVEETESIKPGNSKKTSPVWNHYREITKEIVECLTCNRTIKTSDGASSNLLKHLRNKHPILLETMTLGEYYKEPELSSNLQNNDNNSLEDNAVQNKMTKASAIWVYFKNLSGNKTQCNLCHHLLSARGGTSNLFKHLRARHKNEANAIISMRVGRARGFKRKTKPKSQTGPKKLPKNQSVWNHFSEPSLGLAKCNTCDMLVSSADGDRTNLRKNMRQHMLENHSDVIAELRRSHLEISTLERTNVTGMWRFFTRITDNEVECDECHTRLEHSGRSTYVLLKHMQAKHYDMRESWKLNTNVPTTSRPMFRRPALKWRPELKKPRSVLWKYFNPKNDRRAECIACQKVFSALSTSNLWKHLCAKHADIARNLSYTGEHFDEMEMVDDNVGAEESVATENIPTETGIDEIGLADPEV